MGQYESTIGIATEYQKELLLLRMFKSEKTVKKIVGRFSTGYTHHSRVIDCNEAIDIFGKDKIEVLDSNSKEWNLIWEFYINNRNIGDLLGVLKDIEKVNERMV